MTTDDSEWAIGDLAAATGITVRTLHYYDEIGLVSPSRRTLAGHRRYGVDDVARLHHVVALRGFGVPLADIGRVVDGTPADLRDLIVTQLDQVNEAIVRAHQLKHRLGGVLTALDSAEAPSASALLAIIEETTTMNRPPTREEFAEMAAAREAAMASLTPDQLAEMATHRAEARLRLSDEELARMRAARAAWTPDGG